MYNSAYYDLYGSVSICNVYVCDTAPVRPAGIITEKLMFSRCVLHKKIQQSTERIRHAALSYWYMGYFAERVSYLGATTTVETGGTGTA